MALATFLLALKPFQSITINHCSKAVAIGKMIIYFYNFFVASFCFSWDRSLRRTLVLSVL